MPNRSEIQAFLRANGFEAQANDQASLVFAERLVEVLGEVTPGMIEAAVATPAMKAVDVALSIHQARGFRFDAAVIKDGSPLHQAWRAMWAARFRGE